ncbi:MAG: hypothetical protein HGB00_09120 [Chlorobiaceae bacterium]|nr:hypothetical protein [Chlorobiaceae bacterium]
MSQSNPADLVKNAVGIAGGAALIAPAAPLAPPILHGLAGIAVIGFGLFAAGSLVMKGAEALSGMGNSLKQKGAARKSS